MLEVRWPKVSQRRRQGAPASRRKMTTHQRGASKTSRQGGNTAASSRQILVSLPRIFADMAFAGNQGRIAVPRSRIRR